MHEHSNGSRWCALPAKPMLDSSGIARRNADTGKIEYATVFEFEGRGTRDAFSAAVVRAVIEFDPQAFDREAVS